MLAKEYRLTCTKNELQSVIIKGASDVNDFARKFYQDDILIFESSFIIMLNRRNEIIGWYKVSQGGLDSTVVDKRLVCKVAIDSLCTAVILCHNHPSGSSLPSGNDIKFTNEIKRCLGMFDITLLDHVILAEKEYFSFSDEQVTNI